MQEFSRPKEMRRKHVTGTSSRRTVLARAAALSLLLTPTLFAEPDQPVEITAAIEAVQVYTDRALITRSARIDLGAGISRYRLVEITDRMDDSTVGVNITHPGARIEEVRVGRHFRERFLSEEARQAEAFLREAESKLPTLTDRYNTLKQQERQLSGITVGTVPEDPEDPAFRTPINVDRWLSTLSFVESSLSDNQTALSALLVQIDSAREELLVAITMAERYNDAHATASREIIITVSCNAPCRPGPAPIEIQYQTGGAAWFPVYTARVNSTGSNASMRLSAYALVGNQTGEDWQNVTLRFSAADPVESAPLARLPEWRIRQRVVAREDDQRDVGSGARRTQPSSVADDMISDARVLSDTEEEYAPEEPSPAAEPGGSSQNLLLDRVQEQRARSNEYYVQNAQTVREEQANQRNRIATESLNNLQGVIRNRDAALARNDFATALSLSDQILQRIHALDPRFQDNFRREINESMETRRQALNMLELSRLVRMVRPPRESARGFDVSYASATRDSAASEPGFTRVLLFEQELPLSLHYEATAEANPLAFLAAESSAPDRVLLSGPVSVFHNRDYVGESLIQTVPTDGSFPVRLGASDDIRVVRRADQHSDESGLFRRSHVIDHEITLTLVNQKPRPITIDLFERVPVSTDERVTVSDVNFSETPAERKEEHGLYRFRLQLAPGQERRITIRYRISHGQDVLPQFSEGGPQW